MTAVIDAVPSDRPVTDLYAGVGLFAVALASCGVEAVTAVEGDRLSGADLVHNARACGPAVTAVVDSVERYVRSRSGRADTIIIDPPRTGLSAVAMLSIIGLNPSRLVYVSCDPATMARDARRLLDSGYRMDSLRAFDLFPNTPHVETLGVFLR